MMLAILRDFLHRPGVVSLHFHLRQLKADEWVGLDHAVCLAMIDKAAHRPAKIALGGWRFRRHNHRQGGFMHQPDALVAVLGAEGFADCAPVLLGELCQFILESF
jgi:hypothetical protein